MIELQRKFDGVFMCEHGELDEKGDIKFYEFSKTSLWCLND